MFNINLAPTRYQKILESEGGPLKSLTYHQILIRQNQEGYEASAELKDELLEGHKLNYVVYGNSSGFGSDELQNLAIYKSISEAMEKWAFCSLVKSDQSKLYGFNIETNTTGMAAFPGLFKRSPRQAAYYEAIERWALRHWWGGYLRSSKIDKISNNSYSGIKIVTPWNDVEIALIFSRDIENSFYYYGFAAEKTIVKATYKAELELLRNKRMITQWMKEGNGTLERISEKRLIYFSSEEGFREFQTKISSNNSKDDSSIITSIPKKLVDCRLIGPWEKYAYVWRVLFEPQFKENKNDDHFFCF